jgi:hypothetical protein
MHCFYRVKAVNVLYMSTKTRASTWRLRWHIVKIVFTEEDKVVIKFLRDNKNCGAKHFLAVFPAKHWLLSELKRLLKKIDETGSIGRPKCAGRSRSVRFDNNIERVKQLALSEEDKPGAHFTQREITRETGISRLTVI